MPAAVVAKLGSSKKPAVRVAIKGYTYRSTVASMGGRLMLPVSAEVRERIVISIETAKTPETRERRMAKVVTMLQAGRT